MPKTKRNARKKEPEEKRSGSTRKRQNVQEDRPPESAENFEHALRRLAIQRQRRR